MAFVASFKASVFEGKQGESLAVFLLVLTLAVIIFGIVIVNMTVFGKSERSQVS